MSTYVVSHISYIIKAPAIDLRACSLILTGYDEDFSQKLENLMLFIPEDIIYIRNGSQLQKELSILEAPQPPYLPPCRKQKQQ